MFQQGTERPEPGGPRPGSSGIPRGGFTLVELLVVIAVLAILATLTLPGMRATFDRTHSVQCTSNMKQMGIAVQLFVEDHGGVLPGTSHGISWVDSLGLYLGKDFIGRCPAVPDHRARMTYGWNDCLATNGVGMRQSACRAPFETIAAAELAIDQTSEHFHFSGARGGATRLTANQFKAEVNVAAHGAGANYLFVDGHVETLAWTEVQHRLAQNNSTLVVP